MDCKTLLALIPEECNRRPGKRKRSSSRRKRTARGSRARSHARRAGDGASSSALDNALDVLDYIPRKQERIDFDLHPKAKLKIRPKAFSKTKSTRQAMQQVVNAKKVQRVNSRHQAR